MKNIFLILAVGLSLVFGSLLVPASASAIDCTNPTTAKQQIQCGACGASGQADCEPSDAGGTISDTIRNVVNLLSAIGGIAAVIMIIVAGLRYVTSGGKEEGVKSAKNGILYAVIGLVIIALAQLIVHFVLQTSTKGTTTNTSNKNSSSSSSSGNSTDRKPRALE